MLYFPRDWLISVNFLKRQEYGHISAFWKWFPCLRSVSQGPTTYFTLSSAVIYSLLLKSQQTTPYPQSMLFASLLSNFFVRPQLIRYNALRSIPSTLLKCSRQFIPNNTTIIGLLKFLISDLVHCRNIYIFIFATDHSRILFKYSWSMLTSRALFIPCPRKVLILS